MHDMDMVGVEQAREIVLATIQHLEIEKVPLLESVGRVCARDVATDIDISPFAHAAMDGFALKSADIETACADSPVMLRVIAEVPAGSTYEGALCSGECVRIMTGAPVPEDADTVVKYEIVSYGQGDGKEGSSVVFSAPSPVGANIREAGEELKAGMVALREGEVIHPAGVGFLASCGVIEVDVYRRPRVAVIALGSELVPPTEIPHAGHIRDGNSFAIGACVQAAGGIAHLYPICKDDKSAIAAVVTEAVASHDFVITTGGASNGDYDYIKDVVSENGALLMTLVNMRPGKAQTFGLINETPVFGLPGNPAAAYCGFEMLIRPALRKMQGYQSFERPRVWARLVKDQKKKDPRRIYLRASVERDDEGNLIVIPAQNQSSGLFGALQQGSCLAILPEGVPDAKKVESGTLVECVLLDIEEGVVI